MRFILPIVVFLVAFWLFVPPASAEPKRHLPAPKHPRHHKRK